MLNYDRKQYNKVKKKLLWMAEHCPELMELDSPADRDAPGFRAMCPPPDWCEFAIVYFYKLRNCRKKFLRTPLFFKRQCRI